MSDLIDTTWRLHVDGDLVAAWKGDLNFKDLPPAAKRYAVNPAKDYETVRRDGVMKWGCSGDCVLSMAVKASSDNQATSRAEALDALKTLAELTDEYGFDPGEQCAMDAAYKRLRDFIQQPAIPEGYALVPVNPTIDMTEAGSMHVMKGMDYVRARKAYRAMINAAPKPEDVGGK